MKRYGKRVTHGVIMVDSCPIENGVLCTVARSWLLFLHDESEWKDFESNIAWGVDELHQTFWFEQFLTASCVARFMICGVCRLYFSGLVCSVLSLDECLIKINYGRFCVCFRCLEKVILYVQSFVFGQGRIQIPSLACLFDFVIWNEGFTEVS